MTQYTCIIIFKPVLWQTRSHYNTHFELTCTSLTKVSYYYHQNSINLNIATVSKSIVKVSKKFIDKHLNVKKQAIFHAKETQKYNKYKN